MTRYEILLFLHISAAIIWVGAGFLPLLVMAAILVAGVAYVVVKARAVGVQGQVA